MFGMADDQDTEEHVKAQEILIQHSDVLIPELASILNTSIDNVSDPIMGDYLDQVMGAICNLANEMKDHFSEYYDSMSNSLRRIILDSPDDFNEEMRANAIQIIGFVFEALSYDAFKSLEVRQEAKAYADHFIKDLQEYCQNINDNTTEEEQEIRKKEMMALSGLAALLKEDFFPHVEVLININQQFCKNDPSSVFNILPSGMPSQPQQPGIQTFLPMNNSNAAVSINMMELEMRQNSLETLRETVGSLKDIFDPYIDQTLELFIENARYKYYMDISKTAISSFGNILGAIKDKHLREEKFKVLILPVFIEVLTEKFYLKSPKNVNHVVTELVDCIYTLKGFKILRKFYIVTIN
jgi:hypothetical protein